MTSWEIDGKTVETVADFILGSPKSLQMVTAAMKLNALTSWEESYDQPRQHIKKQRCHFSNKGPKTKSIDQRSMTFDIVKAMVFPVVMYGCDHWTVKKAERQRIDAFELWY